MNTNFIRILFYPIEIFFIFMIGVATYGIFSTDSIDLYLIPMILFYWGLIVFVLYLNYRGLYNYLIIWAAYMDILNLIKKNNSLFFSNKYNDLSLANQINKYRLIIDENNSYKFLLGWKEYVNTIYFRLNDIIIEKDVK